MNLMKAPTQPLTAAGAGGIATSLPGRQSPAPSIFGRVLDYTTRQRIEFVNLTECLEQMVAESGIRDGIAVVQSLHSTAAVFVNEWQDALLEDFRALIEQAVPANTQWRHNDPR